MLRIWALIGALSTFSWVPTSPAQTNQASPSPGSVLVSEVVAMGGANLQGINLSGSAESIAGATDETGTFTASCATSGTSQLTLDLGSDTRTESRQTVNGVPAGSWTDSQGAQHAMAYHNLLSPASWFCPVIALAQIGSATNLNIQDAGQVTKNGANAEHFVVTSPLPGNSPPAALMTHVSQVDLYLDPQTARPLAFDFTAHPDNNSSIDIAIEIQFSNYTQVNGVWLPFTVQRYVNSSLALTLQIQSASTVPSQQ